jgi:epoxyqueuosine reductase
VDRATLQRLCASFSFETIRLAHVERPEAAIRALSTWLGSGFHRDMAYLARDAEVRADPALRLPGARTAVVLSTWYGGARPADPGGRTGLVARYAWGRDYHNQIGKRLRRLRTALADHGVRSWGGVDAAPILERTWAALAGSGYLAKNTMLIQPGRGSWFFLAVLFLDAELEPDRPLSREFCGSCTRCLVACPTDAFPKPGSLDAGRCISYWTIEARELAPPPLLPAFGRWLFGCDVCQEVCPHNHRPPPPDSEDYHPRNAWIDLDQVVQASDEEVLARFTGTPLRRPGASGLKRNALVVLGNLADPEAEGSLRLALQHPAPMVRASAVWAAGRCGLTRLLPAADPDQRVTQEIVRARET